MTLHSVHNIRRVKSAHLPPPRIQPVYYVVQQEDPQNSKSVPHFDSEDKIRPLEVYGDPAVMEDTQLHDNLMRYLWPDLTPTIKNPTRGRYDLSRLTYQDYINQMHHTLRHDLNADVLGYKDGHREGWDGDQYWLTDEEIYRSKGYQKYRKHLKKKAKVLKKSLPVIKWFQKFLEKKAVKLDVVAPW